MVKSRTCMQCHKEFPKSEMRHYRSTFGLEEVIYNCKGCAAKTQALFNPKPEYNLHYVGHAFARRFIDRVTGKYKLTGYRFMEAVERWAKKFPNEVKIVCCDDSCHASSMLVLIEHSCRDKYMGTSVTYIPQCTGETPIEFFLYPGHRKELMNVLETLGGFRKC